MWKLLVSVEASCFEFQNLNVHCALQEHLKRAAAHIGQRAHHMSRGMRDKKRAEGTNSDNLEAIIPVKELESDPEGDVPQASLYSLWP